MEPCGGEAFGRSCEVVKHDLISNIRRLPSRPHKRWKAGHQLPRNINHMLYKAYVTKKEIEYCPKTKKKRNNIIFNNRDC